MYVCVCVCAKVSKISRHPCVVIVVVSVVVVVSDVVLTRHPFRARASSRLRPSIGESQLIPLRHDLHAP